MRSSLNLSHLLLIWIFLAIGCNFVRADTTANGVYGQGGSFTTNNAGTTATALGPTAGVSFDTSGNVYVADFSNNRVLLFVRGSTTATRVYGQGGSFTSGTVNNGGLSANSLAGATGVVVDSIGNVYIADTSNNRVLMYVGSSTTATVVYGQGGSFTSNALNNGGISATSLIRPFSLLLDSSRNLYVCDSGNNRVLFYPAGSTTATRVYGQGGSFTTANSLPITADSLSGPGDLALDNSNNLYIADRFNSRVLFYPSGSTTATRVYGQVSFTVGDGTNPGGVSASTLKTPIGLTLDATGGLYVCDTGNNRVLYYPNNQTVATKVYGQLDMLTTNTANNGGISARSLFGPIDVAIDSTGKLYITDAGNNRMLTYDPAATTTSSGGGTSPPAGTTCFHVSTIITYKGTKYTYAQLRDGQEKECRIPHTVHVNGLKFDLSCRHQGGLDENGGKTILQLTADHLVFTPQGLTAAGDLQLDDQLFGDLESKISCRITSISTVKTGENYFGLNCLQSFVLANGIKTSTFGNYHIIPSIWMNSLGSLFGIDHASYWGDQIATRLRRWNLI